MQQYRSNVPEQTRRNEVSNHLDDDCKQAIRMDSLCYQGQYGVDFGKEREE